MNSRRNRNSKNILALGCALALVGTACSDGVPFVSPPPETLPFSGTTVPIRETLCTEGSTSGVQITSSVLQSPTELTISENEDGLATSFNATITVVEEREDGIVYEWASPETIASELSADAQAAGLQAEFNALPDRRVVYLVDQAGGFSIENRDEVLADAIESTEFIAQLLDARGESEGAEFTRTAIDLYSTLNEAAFAETFALEALLWHSGDGLSITEGASDEFDSNISASFGRTLPAVVTTQHLRDSENCEVFRTVSTAQEAQLAENFGDVILETFGEDIDPFGDQAQNFRESLEGMTYESTTRVRFDEAAGIVRQVSREIVLDIPGETETTTTLEIDNTTPSA